MTDTDRDSIPQIGPTEDTHLVTSYSWCVVAETNDQVTVQLQRTIDPGDSDGIPQQLGIDISERHASGQITGQTFELSRADKIEVLHALAELAFRHGHGTCVEYPILVEDGVTQLVTEWEIFKPWIAELADWDFDDMRMELAKHPKQRRAAGIDFMHVVAAMVADLSPNWPAIRDRRSGRLFKQVLLRFVEAPPPRRDPSPFTRGPYR